MADSAFPRVAALSIGLILASSLICYAALGVSLARPDSAALASLPEASRQQARDLYNDIRIEPWSPLADMRLGEFFLANNRPAPAIAWLLRAVRWDTAEWRAWYYLGLAQRAARHYADADASFKKVLTLNPDYVAARVQSANLLLDQGRDEDALLAFEGLARSGADQTRLAFATGTALLRRRRYEEAERAFAQAIARFAPYGDAHEGMAAALRGAGDEARAARESRLAQNSRDVVPLITDDPLTDQMQQDFPTARSLYQRAARDPDPNNAAATMERALAIDPRMAAAWEAIISIYGLAHRPADAERAWNQLAALDPNNLRGRYDLGVALGRNSEHGKSAVYLNQVLALDPSDAGANRMLGQLAELDGNREEAARQFRTAIEKDPTMAEAHVDLGLLLLKSGDAKEAMAELLGALLPPCEQPERTLARELADLRNNPMEDSFETAVRAQAEQKRQPSLITLLNNRKKPAGPRALGLAGLAPTN
jgi:tetratricopeptide (TPR) repeat protein